MPVTIPARELRNDVSGVLRRVEAGESLQVTVSGRPVAELRPLARRPRTITWTHLQRSVGTRDDTLAADLRALSPDSTDDLPPL